MTLWAKVSLSLLSDSISIPYVSKFLGQPLWIAIDGGWAILNFVFNLVDLSDDEGCKCFIINYVNAT